MNLASILAAALIFAVFAAIILRGIYNRKHNRSSCSSCGGCSGCSGACACHSDAAQQNRPST